MKTLHIALIICIVVAVGIIISTVTNTGTYSDFVTAKNNPGKELHIIGKLDKKAKIEYNARKNANSFTFTMIDNKGEKCVVVYNDNKPQDFEKSEQVVIIGTMVQDTFVARSLLLKCPSKYKNDSLPETFVEKEFIRK
jgi:cytochrome c-type biogenesis protein CcmE